MRNAIVVGRSVPLTLALWCLATTSASAEVCDKILGEAAFDRLMHAPLWYHVGDALLTPLSIGLIALAILTATRVPRLRGIALIAGLVATVQGVRAIGVNVMPDHLTALARAEGCGNASISTAIVASLLALILLAAAVIAQPSSPDPHV